MRLRNALDPKRFYKGGAKDAKLPEFFAVRTLTSSLVRSHLTTCHLQLGHVIASTQSSSTAAPTIARKRTFVEELVDDEQAKAYTKKKFVGEVMVRGMSGRGGKNGKGKGGRSRKVGK
jgi:hypothetical protein